MTDSVYVGNAGKDAALDRGWLLGHFKGAADLRHSEDVEIKWGVHPKGDERAHWVTGEERTALQVLISGRFRVELPGRSVVLAEQGDYVVWGRGVDHSWYAEEESVVLTVRWPSLPGYAVEDKTETACRICGLDDGEVLFDEYGVPQYVICECCHNESGIGDDTVTQVRELRGFWIGDGAQWHDPKRKPADWDLLKQIGNIPPEWR